MKTLLVMCSLFYSVLALSGVAGTSGGSVHKLVVRNNIASAWVCGRGESGVECNWVNFNLPRPNLIASEAQPQKCIIHFGEEAYRPCPSRYGTLIQDLTTYLSK